MEDEQNIKTIFSAMNSMENSSRSQNAGHKKNGIRINPTVFLRMEEFSVKQKWKEVVGPMFANAATSIRLSNKVLLISVNSATIRNELILNKSTICARINKELQKNLVNDMIVT